MRSPVRHPQRVVVVQTTIPDYRRLFFDAVTTELGGQLELLSGDEDWESDIAHSHDFPHTRVRNIFLARRRLLWQAGALRPLLKADIAVISLNPRVVTSWIALLARRLLRRRTLVWGHAWPRKGPSRWTDRLRGFMRRLASRIIVYTETEAEDVARRSPRTDVVAAPNALYRRSALGPSVPTGPVTDVVYVGRLARSKQVELLLDAFLAAGADLPGDVRLVIVGDGTLRAGLEARARMSPLRRRVMFTGHVSSVEQLRDIYARAIVSVSPGFVGLALIQSLGFGVPMILARDADHGPEIEAAIEGVNVVTFSPESCAELAAAITSVVRDRDHWLARRDHISSPIQDRYSIEHMAASFVAALSFGATTPSSRTRASTIVGEHRE